MKKRKKSMQWLLTLVLGVGHLVPGFHSMTYAGTNPPLEVCTAGCTYSSLGAALVAADSGDTIQILTTTLTEADINITKDIVIEGNGQGATVIQASADPLVAVGRVFVVQPNVTVTIRDLTIRRGAAVSGSGGAIWIQPSSQQASVTLESVALRNNEAMDFGGAIFNEGTLELKNVIIDSNKVGTGFGDGGGIFNSGNLNVSGSFVINNVSSEAGGGISNSSSGELIIHNSSVSLNDADSRGAGIFNEGALVATLLILQSNGDTGYGGGLFNAGMARLSENTFFTGNTANNGAAIYNNSDLQIDDVRITANRVTVGLIPNCGGGIVNVGNGHVRISRSDITNNIVQAGSTGATTPTGGGICNYGVITANKLYLAENSAAKGGGAELYFGSTLTLNNSVIFDNSGSFGGGGIHQNHGTSEFTNTTIVSNFSGTNGGGIHMENGSMALANVTIAFNRASGSFSTVDGGGGFYNLDDITPDVSIRSSMIANNSFGGQGDPNPNCRGQFSSGSFSLIGSDPLTLGPECAVGGLTAGLIFNADPLLGAVEGFGSRLVQPLTEGSPAIDNGNCSGTNGPLAVDQRGFGMPVDGDGDGDAQCDIGAYEFGASPRPDNLFLDGFEN